jgi:hypothetical protein
MGLETSTYIDGLVTSNPLTTDIISKGDDHLRLIKSTVKASFPDVDEAVVTIHNSTTAPASKQTGTVWRDTANSLWKFWNGSTWYVLPLAFNATTNLNISGNALISTDTDGDITITPNGSGEIVLDGQKWPQADGDNLDYLTTNGSGQIAWTANTVAASAASATASAATATAQADIATAKAVLTAADVVSCNAVLDTFDDAYLGSKASAPTLDNDSQALADGALYFNTTSNQMFVYDLGSTTWLQLQPTDAEQVNINVVAGNILYQEDLGSIADALSTGSGSDISTVADNIADINALAPSAVIADMALLGESAVIADMALLGDSAIIADMALLGDSAVIADMALLAVPSVITDMDLLGATGVIGDLGTVADSIADVNRYAQEYVISSSTPTSPTPTEGDLWYDSTNNVLKYHNGTGFISIDSGMADLVSDTSPQLGASLDCQNNNINNCGTVDGSNLQMDFGSLS